MLKRFVPRHLRTRLLNFRERRARRKAARLTRRHARREAGVLMMLIADRGYLTLDEAKRFKQVLPHCFTGVQKYAFPYQRSNGDVIICWHSFNGKRRLDT